MGGRFSALPIGAGVFALMGFVITVTQFSRTIEDGVVTDCSFLDYGALACGAVAVVLGFLAAGFSLAEGLKANLVVGLVAVTVGAFHVLSGLGLIGGPCA